MEMKNMNEAMKLQKELTARLAANLDKLQSERAVTLAATVKEQEKLLAEARNELALSEKARENSLQYWDMKISQRKAAVERLEKGLEEMKRKVKEVKKGVGKKAVKPRKK